MMYISAPQVKAHSYPNSHRGRNTAASPHKVKTIMCPRTIKRILSFIMLLTPKCELKLAVDLFCCFPT